MAPLDPIRQLDEALDFYGRRVAVAVRDAARVVLNTLHTDALEFWPQKPSRYGDHPYARNVSRSTWSVREETTDFSHTIILRNDADYSGYVDAGYTRKGAETARSYQQRGSTPYSEQLISRIVQPLRDHVVRKLNGG